MIVRGQGTTSAHACTTPVSSRGVPTYHEQSCSAYRPTTSLPRMSSTIAACTRTVAPSRLDWVSPARTGPTTIHNPLQTLMASGTSRSSQSDSEKTSGTNSKVKRPLKTTHNRKELTTNGRGERGHDSPTDEFALKPGGGFRIAGTGSSSDIDIADALKGSLVPSLHIFQFPRNQDKESARRNAKPCPSALFGA